MNNTALAIKAKENPKYEAILLYLLEDNGFWMKEDIWLPDAPALIKNHLIVDNKCKKGLDFTSFINERLRNEVKFFVIHILKKRLCSANSIYRNYHSGMKWFGTYLWEKENVESFCYLEVQKKEYSQYLKEKKIQEKSEKVCQLFREKLTLFIKDYYDEREETEKDIWILSNLPGVKMSAAEKSIGYKSITFHGIPECYAIAVKRFMRRLVTRRSYSYCRDMIMYIKYFFSVFSKHGYSNGFLEKLSRVDIENYLLWVMNDYAGLNATHRSKAVSYIKQFLSYIQLAESPQAPKKEVERLIFEEDYPRRERTTDTLEKVKYIPEPVRELLDVAVMDIEVVEMIPVYILLRETGWRGTDILNLRYDNCLDYLWNSKEERYVPYLCGEITKTGIPQLRIPIRDGVAEMVRKQIEESAAKSTEENNPTRYLFNTFDGRNMGMPISKPAFVKAIQQLIEEKKIQGADGNLYHFKTHSLRHTRAVEYAEQGMPIGIIQQILGHCSLQMTLHYAKVSENALYEKWKETEKLNLFHMETVPGRKKEELKINGEENIHYEYVRKNLDAVRVPFGTCFKPEKLACRHQMSKCLECPNFCSTKENSSEYEHEIERVKKLIRVSQEIGRSDWEEKNTEYLVILEEMLVRVRKERIIHKNGSLREDII